MTGIATGITGFMVSANIGVVPVRMQGVEIAWGPPGSVQDPIVPLLRMDESGVRSMFQADQGTAIWSSLFSNYQRLRPMIDVESMKAPGVLDFICEKAGKYEKAGSHDAAAMLREVALDIDDSDRRARTDIARSWLVSLREYTESESDRLRISRGLIYGWAESDSIVYKPLLLESYDIYCGRGCERNLMAAASDQLRIALALSEEEPLDADAYGIIGDMLKSAAIMLADSWEKGIDTGVLFSLADEAAELAEKG